MECRGNAELFNLVTLPEFIYRVSESLVPVPNFTAVDRVAF
jgi:hypothetical protein